MQPMLSAKMAVLGEQFVGKSSLAIRWVRDSFSENTEGTIGAAFLTKTVTSGAQQVKLQIWDTAGQERYRSLTPMYYRNAQAAIVVYDVTNHGSFDRAAEWIKELKADPTPKVMVLAANKCDLQHMSVVTEQQGRALASQNGVEFFFTSAKTGQGINEMFAFIVDELPKLEQARTGDGVIRPGGEGGAEPSRGCGC